MQSTNNTSSPKVNTLEPKPPQDVIEASLGVSLDCEYRYVCPYGRGNDTYLKADKQSGNAKVQAKQMAVFNKVIEILQRSSPLCPLNQRDLFEISSEEEVDDGGINANDSMTVHNAKNAATAKAELICSIFNERMKPFIVGDASQEIYLRNLLAAALKWHLAKNLKEDSGKDPINAPFENRVHIEIKDQRTSLDKPEPKLRRASSPTTSGRSEIKLSSKISGSPPESADAKTKKTSTSGNRLHLSLHNLTHSNTGSVSPKRGDAKISPSQKSLSEKDVLREAMIKQLSLESLKNCRSYWINKHSLTSSELNWDNQQYLLVENFKILDNPMMHHLLQCELAKDIAFALDPHILMQDIHRTLDYIDKDHHSRTKAYLRKNILEINNQDSKSNEDVARFNAEVTCFYYILKPLLSELGLKNQKEQETILSMWKHCAQEELSSEGFGNQSFVVAGEKFFREIRKDDDPFSQKVVSLVTLLRQRFYVHPYNLIHEVTPDIALTYLYDDPHRLMRFDFKDGKVEFCTSLKAVPSKEATKWKNGEIKCSGFEIDLVNVMRSDSSDLKSWQSMIKINVNILNDITNKNLPVIKQLFLDPLKGVGFNVDVKFVDNSFSRSF